MSSSLASLSSRIFLRASIFSWTGVLMSSATLSPASFRVRSAWTTRESALLRVSIPLFFFLSSSACCSASFFILSMSSSERFELPVIVMCCSLFVALSWAFTFRIPFESISKVTSTWGTPRGAGGRPSSMNLPRDLLSIAIGRSPWRTWTSTPGWLSAAVEKICDFEVGIAVLRSIRTVLTPPRVSMPSDRGVTSTSRMSFTLLSPWRIPPWSAAPIATTSSGLVPR